MKWLLQKGFTLIELLVVISIISILAAVIFTGFTESLDTSTNKALTTELKQTQLAIELYKNQYGVYPIEIDDQPVGLVPEFISSLPNSADSTNTNCEFLYVVDPGRTTYKYTARECLGGVNETSGFDYNEEMARCPRSCEGGSTAHCESDHMDFHTSFAIYSFGSECL